MGDICDGHDAKKSSRASTERQGYASYATKDLKLDLRTLRMSRQDFGQITNYVLEFNRTFEGDVLLLLSEYGQSIRGAPLFLFRTLLGHTW